MSDTLDAQADGAFAGKPAATSHRTGYTDPLGWALKIARKGGSLGAGEGMLLVEHFEARIAALESELAALESELKEAVLDLHYALRKLP